MHIPDGYLSPETAAAMYVVAVPIWLRATRKVKEVLSSRTVPLVAVFSAFSFIIMMFNVPLPGGRPDTPSARPSPRSCWDPGRRFSRLRLR